MTELHVTTVVDIRGQVMLNIFDSRDGDVEYFYESQLLGEPAPVEDRHFRPPQRRALRLGVTWLF